VTSKHFFAHPSVCCDSLSAGWFQNLVVIRL